MISFRKIILGVFALFCSAKAFPVEYSKCVDGDFDANICDRQTIDDTKNGVLVKPHHVIDFYYGPSGYDALDLEKKARCESCRPGAGGPPIAKKGPNNIGYIDQYFLVPLSKYYRKESGYNCEIDEYGSGHDGVFAEYPQMDQSDWDACDLHFDHVEIRVKCFYDKEHPDGNASC
jgi:hypothetical protein